MVDSERDKKTKNEEGKKSWWRDLEVMKTVRVVGVTGGLGVLSIYLPHEINKALIELERTREYRGYISEFLTTGLSDDIELRIRQAEYFAFLSDGESKQGWKDYLAELENRRDLTQREILALETQAAELSADPTLRDDVKKRIQARELNNRLRWANRRIGNFGGQDTAIESQGRSDTSLASGLSPIPGSELQSFSPKAIELSMVQTGSTATTGSYNVSLGTLDGSTSTLRDGSCRYLAAVANARELWIQQGDLSEVPLEFPWSIRAQSIFPTTVLVLEGRNEFCQTVRSMFDGETPYRSLAREFFEDLPSLTVSREGCTLFGVGLGEYSRPSGEIGEGCNPISP